MPGYLSALNTAQRAAVTHDGSEPLLVIAGAGSGKTTTLAHRVAHLIVTGTASDRILLLTFTRRAAAEMARRAQHIIDAALSDRARIAGPSARLRWAGTFHAIANRLLRLFAESVGLDPGFTVMDRSDSADLMGVLRAEQGLSEVGRRFPKKNTCLAIYSRSVNARDELELTLERYFPWCAEWAEELRHLFRSYIESKSRHGVLDYDDLLLYWFYLVQEKAVAERIGGLFDAVLVDEYQDTNALQAEVLKALKPTGCGVTAVGDDAQSIYGFRAASVRNILEFPDSFERAGHVVTLAQNYRSTQPILEAANRVIDGASQGYSKELFSSRPSEKRPTLATVEDEDLQVTYVVEEILRQREAGVPLHDQAVLFRTAHHSDALEVELGIRNIPYVKYGGLKFLEAAHVKDLLCVLRWAENPRDVIAASRVCQLVRGIGPRSARAIFCCLEAAGFELAALATAEVPSSAQIEWRRLAALMAPLRAMSWGEQVHAVRSWYDPLLTELYDGAAARSSDLDQLEYLAGGYQDRESFLAELTLDPPQGSGDLAGPPHLDEDYLILSTIHSAKGQEWDVVYVLNLADGCIPSDMATGDPEQIDEERRLLYVAMTRAKNDLHLVHPLRFYIRTQHRRGDRHVFTPLSRFLPDSIHGCFERASRTRAPKAPGSAALGAPLPRVDVAAKLRELF